MHLSAAAYDSGASLGTLLLMVSGSLVLLMAAGSAFFYGGLVRSSNVLTMLLMNFSAIALVSLAWIAFAYGLVYGEPLIPHWIGNPLSEIGLGPLFSSRSTDPPEMYRLAFAGFQAAVAIFTVTLVSGAIADRVKFSSWLVFSVVWLSVVFCPIAYWVFNSSDGWAASIMGVSDFAGGSVIHISAGAAALALAFVVRRRVGFGHESGAGHSVPLTLVGAALLWFGWFGLDVGSEASVDGIASLVWVNTLAASAAALLTWLIVQAIREDKPTATGAACGAVAGLVAVTPACNILTPGWSLVLGAVAGAVCAVVVELKFPLGFDDSLDVVGIHLVGGLIGMLYIGLFGTGVGMVYSGSFTQFSAQAITSGAVMAYSFGMTWLLGIALDKTMGFRMRISRASDDSTAATAAPAPAPAET